ncbi:hypothetical protein GGX14DRAFT_600820 [Mycena pura]|uniref:Uncharacterized protein n=1 Tax=Mycena pura TaxID=153505 RepID=A0AAD6UVL8_9AGAR|nr:hypothetical protein GGX14DRAFT_600820 [Mycena pura]
MAANRSQADMELIDGLSTRVGLIAVKSELASSALPVGIRSVMRAAATVWLDPYVSSAFREVNQSFTSDARTFVERIEYLTEIPTLFPDGNVISVEVLAKSQDSDCRKGPSGAGDPTVDVTFVPGEPPITCRRKRKDCKGCHHHCSQLDDALVNVTRYELDVASRDFVLEAQRLGGTRGIRRSRGRLRTFLVFYLPLRH